MIGRGPGSFMGLRLGFSVFRAWAWIYDKDITAVSSLDMAARSFKGDYDIIVPCVDAKMQKVFASIHSRSGVLLEDSDISPENLAALIPENQKTAVLGYDILKDYLDNADFYPFHIQFYRDFLLSIPKENYTRKSKDYLKDIVPNYLRLSAAEIALNQKKEL